MDVKVEEISELTRKVTITLPENLVKDRLDEAYSKLQKESKMKGFRRGKVPRSVIVKSYKPQVEAEVGEKLVQETYFDIIEKQELDPVVHPEISEPSFNEDGSFSYVAQIDVRPDFDLVDYKGIEVEKPETAVEEAAVEFELATLQREMAALKSVEDRAVKMDDIVIVDYQGFHKGHPMKQVKNDDYTVDVGSGRMGQEFEAKLVGMQRDEEAQHEVDFPEKHPNPILAGKTVEFRVKIKDVKERVLAELDDEFAKDVNEKFTTINDLKESIRERLENEKKGAADGELTDRLMQKLLEKNQFEVPERLVRFEIDEMIKQTEEQLEKSGMNLESAGMSREALEKSNRPIAVQRVAGDFILKKIAEVEEIKVNDEDLERSFKRIGEQYNMPVSQVKEFFKNRDDFLPLMNEVLNEKVLNFLREEASLVEPSSVSASEDQTAELKTAEAAANETENGESSDVDSEPEKQ